MNQRPRISSIWRHKKRGTTYLILGHTRLQVPGPYDNAPAVRYRELGDWQAEPWTRPTSMFLDRFEEVSDAH